MKTLQQYLKDEVGRDVHYHTLHAIKDAKGNIFFTLHPQEVDGDPVDFWMADGVLMPAQDKDHELIDFDTATQQWIDREAALSREAAAVYVQRQRKQL